MSNSGAWSPTPPDVNLSENQNRDIVGSVVAIMVLGLASFALRLVTRLMVKGPGLAADDYAIVFAAVMGIGTATTFAFVIVYITCVSATKISILLFYRRVFGTTVVWIVVFGFTLAHWAEVTVTWLAGCRPIDYYWNYWKQYTDPESTTGSCIDAPLFYFSNGIIGLVIDVAILLVPIPTIRRLNMPTTKKVFVGGILLLGSFVCVASAVRIVKVDVLVKSEDFTWAMSQVFIWSCYEPFIGIVCACLPTYGPLVRCWYHPRGRRDIEADMPRVSIPHKTTKSGKRDRANRMHGTIDVTGIRGDDEIELTVDISVNPRTQRSPDSVVGDPGENGLR
ncbi:hypothetical protein QBC38DRAFT_540152 [Podospora fimiseda]|uniref:Rhodopsin domain-containing protein n=1 Tax=Podospora fimiseda TaxID=252190 RepID=A0AAN6YLP5_9PEZI|nr:hypothetical protein QBC38DRAFT_540152 [Podospora fimiseda]